MDSFRGHLVVLMAFSLGATDGLPQEQAARHVLSTDSRGTIESEESVSVLGPAERNRFWHVYNNRCHAPEGMTATPLETNLCLAVHRDTSPATKRRAILVCRRIGAIRFYDWQTDVLVEALGRARPDYFIAAVRLVASQNRLGRFVLELISDRDRVVLVLTNQQVPLEDET